jgi:phosphatidylcholine synthase
MNAPSREPRAAAWAVHAYTASGTVLAFAALVSIGAGDFRSAFLWLFIANAIDASDGILARAVDVKRRLPEIDGAHLDDIVDYLTFVFVPFALMHASGLLVGWTGRSAIALALLTSALRFCHSDAKTSDHFFTGFPSYWNVIALYLYVFAVPPAVNAAVIAILALLVLAPLRFLYPSRMTWMRTPTIALGVLWGVALLAILWRLPARSPWLASASLLYPAYYTGLSFYLQWKDAIASRSARPSRPGSRSGATR